MALSIVKKIKGNAVIQNCLIFTDAARVRQIELEVASGATIDHERHNAFKIDFEEQYLGEDGKWYQVIYERSALPVYFKTGYDKDKEEQMLNSIGVTLEESFQRKINEDYEAAQKGTLYDKLIILASIICVTALIGAALGFLSNRGG